MQRELMKSFGNESEFSPMPLTAVQANTFLVIPAWLHVHVNGKSVFMHMVEILSLTVDPHKLSVLSLCVQRKN